MFEIRFRQFVVIVAVLALAVVLGAGVALAQNVGQTGEPPAVPALPDVLAMLAQGIGVGAVIAFLFERVKWFQDLSPDAKWWTVFVLSIGLPLVATVLLKFIPSDVWVAVEPYWKAIATGFLIWVGSQVAHKLHLL